MTQSQKKGATAVTGIFALALAGLLALASFGCGTGPCDSTVLPKVYASSSVAFERCPHDCASADLNSSVLTNAESGWKCVCVPRGCSTSILDVTL